MVEERDIQLFHEMLLADAQKQMRKGRQVGPDIICAARTNTGKIKLLEKTEVVGGEASDMKNQLAQIIAHKYNAPENDMVAIVSESYAVNFKELQEKLNLTDKEVHKMMEDADRFGMASNPHHKKVLQILIYTKADVYSAQHEIAPETRKLSAAKLENITAKMEGRFAPQRPLH